MMNEKGDRKLPMPDVNRQGNKCAPKEKAAAPKKPKTPVFATTKPRSMKV